jgi:hypothetical protein
LKWPPLGYRAIAILHCSRFFIPLARRAACCLERGQKAGVMTERWRVSLMIWIVLALPCFACAQQGDPELRQVAVTPIPSLSAGPMMFLSPMRCDSRGTVYYRGAPRFQDLKTSSVVGVRPDGASTVTFDLAGADKDGMLTWQDFDVDESGDLFALALDADSNVFLVRFSGAGEYVSRAKLVERILARRFVSLPQGRFLVTGQAQPVPRPPSAGPLPPYTAILEATKVVAHVELPEDPVVSQDRMPPDQWSRLTDLTKVVRGDDGNTYLMRPTEHPVVYAISQDGRVQRRLVLGAPSEGLMPSDVKVAGGRIIVEFTRSGDPGRRRYALFDARTGKAERAYKPTNPPSGMLACYTEGQLFTFLGYDPGSGHRALIRARP